MADALEQLQYVLSGIGLTQLPRILQGLQKARGVQQGSEERQAAAGEGSGPPTLPSSPGAPQPDDDPLAGISAEQAAQLIPELMAMARQDRAGSAPPAPTVLPAPPVFGQGQSAQPAARWMPTRPQATIPRVSTMEAGR